MVLSLGVARFVTYDNGAYSRQNGSPHSYSSTCMSPTWFPSLLQQYMYVPHMVPLTPTAVHVCPPHGSPHSYSSTCMSPTWFPSLLQQYMYVPHMVPLTPTAVHVCPPHGSPHSYSSTCMSPTWFPSLLQQYMYVPHMVPHMCLTNTRNKGKY